MVVTVATMATAAMPPPPPVPMPLTLWPPWRLRTTPRRPGRSPASISPSCSLSPAPFLSLLSHTPGHGRARAHRQIAAVWSCPARIEADGQLRLKLLSLLANGAVLGGLTADAIVLASLTAAATRRARFPASRPFPAVADLSTSSW